MRTMLGVLGAVLTLGLMGCGDDDCAKEFRGAGGKTFCMPDPSEEMWACIPIDEKSTGECPWVPEGCSHGIIMLLYPEGDGYEAACECLDDPGYKCDGKPHPRPKD